MTVNTTWVNPAGATLDISAGTLVGETNWDAAVSGLYRLGGTDGNAKTGKYQIGSTQAFSNANMTQGLTINQDTNDDEAFAVKSTTDVAHGITSFAETDVYYHLKKKGATTGGALMRGYSSSTIGMELVGAQTTGDTSTTGSTTAAIVVTGQKKSGTSLGAHGTNEKVFAVRDDVTNQFMVDAEGDMFNNGASGTSTTFDDADDGALVEALTTLMNPQRQQGYKFQLATDLEAHKQALAAGGVIHLNEHGGVGFISYKGVLGLLIDGIRQVTHAHRQLAAQVAPLLTTTRTTEAQGGN